MAALLLLLCALVSATSASAAQYNTLIPSPLRSSPAVVPDSSDLLTWTPDSATLADGDTSDDSLHLPLYHRDSLLAANSTPPAAILRQRLHRDAARVQNLHDILTGSASAAKKTSRSFSSAVVPISGDYVTRIGVGTPPTYAYMVLDTGSNIVWLQCSPCRRCYNQTFDPRRSRSYAPVRCGGRLCRRLGTAVCDPRRRACLYQAAYGDGSNSTGDFSTETLTFGRGKRFARVAFGCGHEVHDTTGIFAASAGMLGLGRAPVSFASQVARRFGHRFSYCLVDPNFPATKSSSLVFGDAAVPRGAKSAAVAFTPMLQNPRMITYYYIELTGFSVDGTRVPGVTASDLKLDPATGLGGVIVDSGTTVTRLVQPVYEALRDAFKARVTTLRPAAAASPPFDTCYDLPVTSVVKVPTVTMHLAGGAEVLLPTDNFLLRMNTTVCFAFVGTVSDRLSIIGNIQQQGFRVIFDGAQNRIGFAPDGC